MSEDVLQIVRTGKDQWLFMEDTKPHQVDTSNVIHYLKGRTRQAPKLIQVIDPLEEDK